MDSIKIEVATYAAKEVLKSFVASGIRCISATVEDKKLIFVVSKDELCRRIRSNGGVTNAIVRQD